MEGTKKQDLSLRDLKSIMNQFVTERDWHQYHTPRNLLLALVGQVGELAEIYQWKGEVKPKMEGLTQKEKQNTMDEIADVLAYLIRFADVSGIDLSEAFVEKMKKNRQKYPADIVRGSSDKYTEYANKQ